MGKKLLILMSILLIAMLALTGCAGNGEDVTITFESNGGTEIGAISAKPGTIIDVPDAPTKDGYGFDGWYRDAELSDMYIFGVMGNEDLTLYAKWVTSYTIVLHGNGGTGTNLDSYPVGGSAVLPTDWTRENFIFDGWYRNPEFSGDPVSEIGEGSRGTRHFFAKWRKPSDFKIILMNTDTDDVTKTKFDDTYDEGVVHDLPDDWTRAGYEFGGWYKTEDFSGDRYYEISALERGELVFYAKWIAQPFTITFDTMGGNETYESVVVLCGDAVELPKPTHATLTFDGWYLDETYETPFTGEAMPPNDITIYAKWVEQFDLKYDFGDGNIVVVKTDIGAVINSTELIDPTTHEYNKPDMVFDGWYYDAGYNEPVGDTVTMDSSKTLYAKWKAVLTKGFFPYKTTFDKAKTGYIDITSPDMLTSFIEYMIFEADKNQTYKLNLTFATSNREEAVKAAYDRSTMSNTSYVLHSIGMGEKVEIGLPSSFIATGYTTATGQKTNIEELESIFDNVKSSRQPNYDSFAYTKRSEEVEVQYSDQLFYVLEHGMKPVPVTGSPADDMLNKAKAVLRDICDDDMTPIAKSFAIYTWLSRYNTYDYVAARDPKYASAKGADLCDAYHMEGIFNNNIAVCDGISKAYSVLANIEGIPCVRIVSDNHAWNKVYLDANGDGKGEWYGSDATWANGSNATNNALPTFEYMDSKHFLFTDVEKAQAGQVGLNHLDLVADTDVNFGQLFTVNNNGAPFDLYITSDAELTTVIKYMHKLYNSYGIKPGVITVDLYLSDEYKMQISKDKVEPGQDNNVATKLLNRINEAVKKANLGLNGEDFTNISAYFSSNDLDEKNHATILLYGRA